jgi:hypothetical protein
MLGGTTSRVPRNCMPWPRTRLDNRLLLEVAFHVEVHRVRLGFNSFMPAQRLGPEPLPEQDPHSNAFLIWHHGLVREAEPSKYNVVASAGSADDALVPSAKVRGHRSLDAMAVQVVKRTGPEQPAVVASTAVIKE